MYRDADDQVICCQYDADAQRIKVALGNRLAKHNLTSPIEMSIRLC